MALLSRIFPPGLLRLALALALVLPPPATQTAEARLSFSGGSEGGTFQVFAQALSNQISNERIIEVFDVPSAGSVENICRIQAAAADFSIAYAGDIQMARSGKMPGDNRQYKNIRVLADLYGAPAHLITLTDSGIETLADLKGSRIAVGGTGPGAAATALRFFSALGLGNAMKIDYFGYSKAASALFEGRIQALWVFAKALISAGSQVASGHKIKILDTWQAGAAEGFFNASPVYSPATLPSGTYAGVDYPVQTFEDSALWVAGKHVDPQHVRAALTEHFQQRRPGCADHPPRTPRPLAPASEPGRNRTAPSPGRRTVLEEKRPCFFGTRPDQKLIPPAMTGPGSITHPGPPVAFAAVRPWHCPAFATGSPPHPPRANCPSCPRPAQNRPKCSPARA